MQRRAERYALLSQVGGSWDLDVQEAGGKVTGESNRVNRLPEQVEGTREGQGKVMGDSKPKELPCQQMSEFKRVEGPMGVQIFTRERPEY